jgi:DNA-directed RNA polymerase specialized sigma24 family protein
MSWISSESPTWHTWFSTSAEIAGCQNDNAFFAKVYERFRSYARTFRWYPLRHEAEEVICEALGDAFLRLRTETAPDKKVPSLYTIFSTAEAKVRRRRNKAKSTDPSLFDFLLARDPPEAIPEWFMKWLNQTYLPDDDPVRDKQKWDRYVLKRLVVFEHVLHGLTFDELEVLFDKPRGTIHSIYKAAVRELEKLAPREEG